MKQFSASGNHFRLGCGLRPDSTMTPGARLKSAISDADLSVLDPDRHRHPVSPAMPPAHVLTASGELLRALSAPVRIAIVVQLCESSRCVHELVGGGVVAGDRAGREVRYRLIDEHLADIVVAAITHAAEGR